VHPALFWFLLASVPVAVTAQAADPQRPNVILIMADDLGFSDLGCYGAELATPNLDRLAAEGLRFTHFTNAARCCPTRAALMTGMYPHQVGVGHMVEDLGLPAYKGDLDRDRPTLAELLKSAGYRTAMAGKWHLTPPPPAGPRDNWPRRRGFERYFGIISSVRSYFDPPTLTRNDDPIEAPPDFYLTDAVSDSALAYLREFAQARTPFFLYAAYTAPHWPLHALPEDIAAARSRSQDTYAQGWDRLRTDRHRRMIDLGIVDPRWPLSPRDPEATAWNETADKAWQVERMVVYAAMIACMDRGIGRLMDQLRASGLEENTLVLFLADNGGCAEAIVPEWRNRFPALSRGGEPSRVGNDPAVRPGPAEVFQSYGLAWANASNTPFRRFKHWVHEGGIASPLIVRWPAGLTRPPGTLSHEPGHVIDMLPTCLDVAGIPYPATFHGRPLTPVEGRSLRPAFAGRPRDRQDALYWEHEGNRAVRQGRWKLVAPYPQGWELYDLEADRTEQHDLASTHPEIVRTLSNLYDRWADRCGVRPWDEVSQRRVQAGVGN
jgi:arylsulfatase A-like enzyme